MRIGFIGAGKVGFTFGKYVAQETVRDKVRKELGIELTVNGYYSAHEESARAAATFTDTRYYNSLEELKAHSDVIFLTVPDGQIQTVWEELSNLDIKGKIICHASGAMTSEIFSGITEAGAFGYSIHPMYAISSKYESYMELENAYITVEGHERYAQKIKKCIEVMGNKCVVIEGKDKVMYHGAAVFASNLVTGLLSVSQELLCRCGFSYDQALEAVTPLFLGNASAAVKLGTVESLTGPVERCDVDTVKKHLQVLDGEHREAYIAVSKCLVEVARKKHSDRDYEGLIRVLNGIGEL